MVEYNTDLLAEAQHVARLEADIQSMLDQIDSQMTIPQSAKGMSLTNPLLQAGKTMFPNEIVHDFTEGMAKHQQLNSTVSRIEVHIKSQNIDKIMKSFSDYSINCLKTFREEVTNTAYKQQEVLGEQFRRELNLERNRTNDLLKEVVEQQQQSNHLLKKLTDEQSQTLKQVFGPSFTVPEIKYVPYYCLQQVIEYQPVQLPFPIPVMSVQTAAPSVPQDYVIAKSDDEYVEDFETSENASALDHGSSDVQKSQSLSKPDTEQTQIDDNDIVDYLAQLLLTEIEQQPFPKRDEHDYDDLLAKTEKIKRNATISGTQGTVTGAQENNRPAVQETQKDNNEIEENIQNDVQSDTDAQYEDSWVPEGASQSLQESTMENASKPDTQDAIKEEIEEPATYDDPMSLPQLSQQSIQTGSRYSDDEVSDVKPLLDRSQLEKELQDDVTLAHSKETEEKIRRLQTQMLKDNPTKSQIEQILTKYQTHLQRENHVSLINNFLQSLIEVNSAHDVPFAKKAITNNRFIKDEVISSSFEVTIALALEEKIKDYLMKHLISCKTKGLTDSKDKKAFLVRNFSDCCAKAKKDILDFVEQVIPKEYYQEMNYDSKTPVNTLLRFYSLHDSKMSDQKAGEYVGYDLELRSDSLLKNITEQLESKIFANAVTDLMGIYQARKASAR